MIDPKILKGRQNCRFFYFKTISNSKRTFKEYFYFVVEKMQMKYRYFCYLFKEKSKI